MMRTNWEEDCMRWRGKLLNGKYSHWCPEWDDLPVDETCGEFEVCCCFPVDEDVEKIQSKMFAKRVVNFIGEITDALNEKGKKEMENQHRKIKGYRELNDSEIDNMNRITELGAEIGILVDDLRDHPDHDQRWVSIGATDIQKGLMALTRSVEKPESF